MQVVKGKKIAAIGSLILLALNLAFTIYPYIEHRGVHPWVAIPLLFIFIAIVIWMSAHFYVRVLEMYKYEAAAEKAFNPYAVHAIAPYEEMMYRHLVIPQLEAIYSTMEEGGEKKLFRKQIDKFKGWVELGDIPKKDFPEHLLKFYLTKKEGRI